MTLQNPPRGRPAVIVILILFFAAFFAFNGTSQAGEVGDQCVSCHTDMAKMKQMIAKFPDPPEEEGEA